MVGCLVFCGVCGFCFVWLVGFGGVCIKIFKAREIGLKRVVFIRFTK